MLSVILINYNDCAMTLNVLSCLGKERQEVALEIIVVENTDNPAQRLPEPMDGVFVLRNVENNGFGHACNLGAAAAKGEWLLFLNNDTVLEPGALKLVLEFAKQQPQCGAVGICTLLPDGSLDHGCKRGFPTPMASLFYFTHMDRLFPKNRAIGAYRQTFVPIDAVAPVDAVSGAFLLLRKSLFLEIGGFDEQFFMYGEDLDLCYRIAEAGYQSYYFGKAGMTHFKGQSGLSQRSPKVVAAFYEAMHIFYQKHYQQKYGPLCGWLVHHGIDLKHALTKRNQRGAQG